MKIDLYTKTVFTVIAISAGFLIFDQYIIKEAQANKHVAKASQLKALEERIIRLEKQMTGHAAKVRKLEHALEQKAREYPGANRGVAPSKMVNSSSSKSKPLQASKPRGDKNGKPPKVDPKCERITAVLNKSKFGRYAKELANRRCPILYKKKWVNGYPGKKSRACLNAWNTLSRNKEIQKIAKKGFQLNCPGLQPKRRNRRF